jgi:DoxX-like protein
MSLATTLFAPLALPSKRLSERGQEAHSCSSLLACLLGVWDILRIEYVREILEQQLGYPAYFSVIMGVWKVPGAVALLVPRFPRLKVWPMPAQSSYTGAAASWALRLSARRDLAPGPSSWILARPFASR